MKAKINHVYEGHYKSSEQHTIVVVFKKMPESNECFNDSENDIDYSATFDIARIFSNYPECQTDGIYDPRKGFIKAKEFFSVDKIIEDDNIMLISLPISEISDHPYVLNAKTGEPLYALNRLGFWDNKNIARKQLQQSLTEGINNGTFLIPRTTNVIVMSCQNKPNCNHDQHIVELSLIKDLHLGPILNSLYVSQIGVPQYILTVDLIQRYKSNPLVRTNGQYDRHKALNLCKQEFPEYKSIALDCELYEFSINELTNEKNKWLNSSVLGTFYYADFEHNREIAKRKCLNLIREKLREENLLL